MIVPRRSYGWVVTLVLLLGLVAWCGPKYNPVAWILDAFVPEPQVIPYISHVVLFQFKKGTAPATIKEVNSKLLALKKSCINPTTRLPYIVSITGGKDMSVENKQDGFTHAFIVRFNSREDRDYYVERDPIHKQFKDAAAAVVNKIGNLRKSAQSNLPPKFASRLGATTSLFIWNSAVRPTQCKGSMLGTGRSKLDMGPVAGTRTTKAVVKPFSDYNLRIEVIEDGVTLSGVWRMIKRQ